MVEEGKDTNVEIWNIGYIAVHGQEAEMHTGTQLFLLFIQSGTQARGTVPPTVRWVFPI